MKYDNFMTETQLKPTSFLNERKRSNNSDLKVVDTSDVNRRANSAAAVNRPRRLKSIPNNQIAKRIKRNTDISRDVRQARMAKAPTVEI